MTKILQYFAPCTLGLETALEQELEDLGAQAIATVPGGAKFAGDVRLGYAANLWLRSAIRVQELLCRFTAKSTDELYAVISDVDWSRYMAVDQTLAIDVSVKDSVIRHSKYAAQISKDAIVDQFRKLHDKRPSVDRYAPDLPLKLVIRQDEGILYRNMSGVSLHKRGWRPIQVKSPLNEATAAGLLILSGWDRRTPIVDPMCGSGTFIVEAAMLAIRRAPGLGRFFPFEVWPDFEREVWEGLLQEARNGELRSLPFVLEGADRHPGALSLAVKGAEAAQVAGFVSFACKELKDFKPRVPPAMVFVNPPYGERLGRGEDLLDSWRDLGTFLHTHCKGAVAHVLCGDSKLTKILGLRASRKHPFMNGSLDCRFLRYEIRGETEKRKPGKPEKASPWVERFLPLLTKGSRCLDVAAGLGRHCRALLRAEHEVLAVDRDVSGLGFLKDKVGFQCLEANLEDGSPWVIEERSFDLVLVTNYLWRENLPRLLAAVAKGGLLIYETFAVGQENFGKPTNPDFLLEPGELLRAVEKDFVVLAYEHGEVAEPKPAMLQRIVARRL